MDPSRLAGTLAEHSVRCAKSHGLMVIRGDDVTQALAARDAE
ncbi:hypothetical protein ACQPXB_20945 [Amycolatopsis sp. CA-161197]